MKRFHILIAIAAALGGARLSAQDFSDNFDAYATGNLCTQSTWVEWCGSFDVCGEVSNEQAHSGSNSLKLVGNVGGGGGLGDDTVHTFDVAGGQWTFTAWTYCPSDMVGAGFIILLNTYPLDNCPGGNNWSLQVWLDGDLSTVHADFTGEQLPLIRDRWVEFRAEIDLDNDVVDYYYDGVQFVFGKSWIDGISGGGQPTIQALDLYAGEPTFFGSSGHYIDDVSLVEAGADVCPDGAAVKAKYKDDGNPGADTVAVTLTNHVPNTEYVVQIRDGNNVVAERTITTKSTGKGKRNFTDLPCGPAYKAFNVTCDLSKKVKGDCL